MVCLIQMEIPQRQQVAAGSCFWEGDGEELPGEVSGGAAASHLPLPVLRWALTIFTEK